MKSIKHFMDYVKSSGQVEPMILLEDVSILNELSNEDIINLVHNISNLYCEHVNNENCKEYFLEYNVKKAGKNIMFIIDDDMSFDKLKKFNITRSNYLGEEENVDILSDTAERKCRVVYNIDHKTIDVRYNLRINENCKDDPYTKFALAYKEYFTLAYKEYKIEANIIHDLIDELYNTAEKIDPDEYVKY